MTGLGRAVSDSSRPGAEPKFRCIPPTAVDKIKSMNTEQFLTILHQSPFRPFKIRMADGRAFDVTHRDFVAISPQGRSVIVFQPDESFSVLDLLLMSELQVGGGNAA